MTNNWGCPPGPPVPPTLDLCPEKIETTVILSNEIQRLPHLQRFGVTFTWACLVELLSRGHITLWILDKGAFSNYVDKILILFHHLSTLGWTILPWTWKKPFIFIFWTTYPPHLVHVVIECPLRQSLFNCAWCIQIILRSYRIKLHHSSFPTYGNYILVKKSFNS